MNDWALILGSSSGFGAATCREISSHGINIYGIHLDRRATMDSVNLLIEELKNNNVEVKFNYMNAADVNKRKAVITKISEILGSFSEGWW